MKIYNIHTKFTFGKYKGKTLLEVAQKNPSYISWCLLNIDHFTFSHDTFYEIEEHYPDFDLEDEASYHLIEEDDYLCDNTPFGKKEFDDVDYWGDTKAALLDGTDIDIDDFDGDFNDLMAWSGR